MGAMKKKPKKSGRPNKMDASKIGMKIQNIIAEAGGRTHWSSLWKRALKRGMSTPTLSKYLKELEKAGRIGREADLSTRPPRVYYYINITPPDPDLPEIETRFYKQSIDRMIKQLDEEKDNRDKELAQVRALKQSLHYLFIEQIEIWKRYSSHKNEEEALKYLALAINHTLIPLIQQTAPLVNPKYGQIRDKELKAYFAVGYRLGLLSRHDWENWNQEGLIERPE